MVVFCQGRRLKEVEEGLKSWGGFLTEIFPFAVKTALITGKEYVVAIETLFHRLKQENCCQEQVASIKLHAEELLKVSLEISQNKRMNGIYATFHLICW